MKTIITGCDDNVELDSKYYIDFILSMDRIFKSFLNLLKKELINLNITDINSIQGLIIYNLGHESMHTTELISRGYYTGSNVSYNLKKLIELGYIEQNQSETDKRSYIVRLTNNGLKLLRVIEKIFALRMQLVKNTIPINKTKKTKHVLQKIIKTLEDLSKK